jgi:hypothetical protein
MARSLATWDPAPIVAAAAAWMAAGAVVVAVPAPPPPLALPTVAAHGAAPASSTRWKGAPRVYAEVDRRARRLRADERARIARVILEESARAELAPILVLAVIEVESGYDVGAVSPVGAVGLMQLMLPTMREELALAGAVARDPFDPVANVRAGVRYLGRLVEAFSNLELALMAYNAGPNRIRRHLHAGSVPARFHGYPRDVLRRAARLAPSPGEPLVPRALGARPTAVAVHRPASAAPRQAIVASARAASPAPGAAPPPLPAAPPPATVARGYDPAILSTPGGACVRLEPALPISRGRDRPRSVERALSG